MAVRYAGAFTSGTAQIPLTMNTGGLPALTIGAIPGPCGSATTVDFKSQTNGRFFFFDSDNFTTSSLAVRGIVNNTAAQTITIYAAMEGGAARGNTRFAMRIESYCQGDLNGATLTRK